ncbi:MAG: ferrous iron transport protein A [Ruminococcaceae bacterium]|nr:ferrous iron transport protein A [Oscillospiraceae bacterium]
MELPLSELALGECAYISRAGEQTDMSRRLTQLGFLPGTRVKCELIAPAGDPAAYRVRGALIALRAGDAGSVMVVPDSEVCQ